ncbi:hypothetical protein V1477_015184, partial [Vespula maculifrons]
MCGHATLDGHQISQHAFPIRFQYGNSPLALEVLESVEEEDEYNDERSRNLENSFDCEDRLGTRKCRF